MGKENGGHWLIFIVLSVIWGSSFILMKEGLKSLSAYQVATLRIVSAGLVLIPFAVKAFKTFSRKSLWLCVLAGLLGNLFPAFLFCVAEEKIDSSLAGMLNSLTPIFAILFASVFFRSKIPVNKVWGILLAFGGTVCLFFARSGMEKGFYPGYAALVIVATMMYGFNANLISVHLKNHSTLLIAGFSIATSAVIALIILILTGYFKLEFDKGVIYSTGAASVLGIFGSAIATILYFRLIQNKGVVFASMITYAIPFVAVIWGVFYGETIQLLQIAAMLIILAGVFIVNKRKRG